MGKFIQPEVAALGEDPSEGSSHEVVMVVNDDRDAEALHILESHDGMVVDDLPLGMYLISVPEKAITPLSQSNAVRSLQFGDNMEVLAGGNV